MSIWTYEEKFDNLTTGALNGQDGWTSTDSVSMSVSTNAAAIYEGTKGLESTSAGSASQFRDITEVDHGTFYVSLKSTETTRNSPYIGLRNESAGLTDINILFQNDGTIRVYDGSGPDWVQIGTETYSVNTWYRIGIQFRCTGAVAYEGLTERTFKANVNNGTWQGPYQFERASGTGLSQIQMYGSASAGNTDYIDYISPYYEEKYSNMWTDSATMTIDNTKVGA